MDKKILFNVVKDSSFVSLGESSDNVNFDEENNMEPATHVSVDSESVSSYEAKDYELTPLEAIACASVLEESADELSILAHMGNLPDVEADIIYKTLDERFSHAAPDPLIYDPQTIEPYQIALDKQKFVKFQVNRSFVEKIVRQTIQDITTKYSYHFLVKQINLHEKKLYEENELLDKQLQNKVKLRELKFKLESERRTALAKIQKTSELLGNLKDQYEDLIYENKIKINYIENWENSRMEQNLIILDKQEESEIQIINTAKSDIEKETRISAEVETFIIETQRGYEEEIQMWMDSYDREVELRDTEIQVLKEKREEQFNRLQNLSLLYDKHNEEIQDYLKLKEERRKEAELAEKRNKAAIKIQAWWKGTMVRRCLGPYRKKKKGKDAKGGNKKKGKK